MHLGVLIGDLGPVVKVCNGSGRPKAVRGHTDAYRIKAHVWSLAAVGERIDKAVERLTFSREAHRSGAYRPKAGVRTARSRWQRHQPTASS